MTYHNYILFQSDKSLLDIPQGKITVFKKQFIQEIEKENKVLINSYTTLGFKVNTSILLWFQSDSIDLIQDLANNLMHTKLGRYMKITYTLFGIARATQYSPNSKTSSHTNRKGGKYLIIYPFTKTQDWYMLSFEKRQELMKGHIAIGRKYPQISQLLLYSYGIDDNEFIVSYETDNLSDFQNLVIELRSDKVREYTLNDTPIITCIYRPIEKSLSFL